MQRSPEQPTGAPVDAPVDSVDALAAALAVDPVNVQQARGNGHTAEVDAALTELVGSADVPVFVALVGDLPGLEQTNPGADLLTRLQSRLGQDGVYVVAVGDARPTWDYTGTDPDLEDAVREGRQATFPESYDYEAPQASDAGEAAIIVALVGDPDRSLSEEQVELYSTSPTWTEVRYDSAEDPPSESAVVAWAALLGVLVALVGWRLTRTWALRATRSAASAGKPGAVRPRTAKPTSTGSSRPARSERTEGPATGSPRTRPAPDPSAPQVAEVRAEATRVLDSLARRLADAGAGPRVETAIGCRVAAEQVLDSEDLLDVVGALVLARAGVDVLRTGATYRPCFVNPLHGRGSVEVEVTDAATAGAGAGAALTVPACRRCGSTRGQQPRLDPLLEPARGLRSPRPYYEGSTVWARTGFGALDPDVWRLVVEER